MARPRFIQIHGLASYPATLLNRDGAGMAKRLPFGGADRARISSQALKRRWRFAGEASHEGASRVPHALQGLGMPMGDRSKEVVERMVLPQALKGLPALHSQAEKALSDALVMALYGNKGVDLKSRQALFFGRPETDYVTSVARGLAELAAEKPALRAEAGESVDKKVLKAFEDELKDALAPLQKNLRTLADNTRGAAGLESALFGRMVTTDPSANVDAPVHVAHAFTVHRIERELDYVTAVDDLRTRDDDAGSAGLFDAELTSGLYYTYVNIDVELLVGNLAGDAGLAGQVADRLLQLIARTSPGAKKGSTAPFAHAEFLLVEMGDDQPRTLANAFRQPVPLQGDIFAGAMRALQTHLGSFDRAYGVHTERLQLSVTPPAIEGVPEAGLADICAAIRERIGAA